MTKAERLGLLASLSGLPTTEELDEVLVELPGLLPPMLAAAEAERVVEMVRVSLAEPHEAGQALTLTVHQALNAVMRIAVLLRVLRAVVPEMVIWPPEPLPADPDEPPYMVPGPERPQ